MSSQGLLSSLQSDNRRATPLPVVSNFRVSADGMDDAEVALQHFVVGGEAFPFAAYKVVDGRLIGLDTKAPMMVAAERRDIRQQESSKICYGESKRLALARHGAASLSRRKRLFVFFMMLAVIAAMFAWLFAPVSSQ